MNITEIIAQNPELMRSVCQFTGLSEQDFQKVATHVLPALSKGIKTAAIHNNKTNELQETLNRESTTLTNYVNAPRDHNPEEIRREGEKFLGLMFGDKEVSRNVAKKVSEKTGVNDVDIKNALPFLATAIMGIFNQKYNQPTQQLRGTDATTNTTLTQNVGDQTNPNLNSLLLEFFDADKDGSVLDDFMGMIGKFFGIGETRH